MVAAGTRTVALVPALGRELERLFDQWRTPLMRYLLASGTKHDEALDVVQDTFLRLHQHLLSGGGRDNLRAWVFRVAHNSALNRRMSAERRLASLEEHSGIAEKTISPGDTPEALLLKKERWRRLHSAMQELSAAERGCILLRSEGLRYREIAAVLAIGVSTVADHLDRALRKLGDKCNV